MTTGRINQVTVLSGYCRAHSQKTPRYVVALHWDMTRTSHNDCTEVRPGRVDCKTGMSNDLPLRWERRVILWLSLSNLTAYTIVEGNSERNSRGLPKAYTWCGVCSIRTTLDPRLRGELYVRHRPTNEFVVMLTYQVLIQTLHTFRKAADRSPNSLKEGLNTLCFGMVVESMDVNHFDSPPNKPHRGFVIKGSWTYSTGFYPRPRIMWAMKPLRFQVHECTSFENSFKIQVQFMNSFRSYRTTFTKCLLLYQHKRDAYEANTITVVTSSISARFFRSWHFLIIWFSKDEPLFERCGYPWPISLAPFSEHIHFFSLCPFMSILTPPHAIMDQRVRLGSLETLASKKNVPGRRTKSKKKKKKRCSWGVKENPKKL